MSAEPALKSSQPALASARPAPPKRRWRNTLYYTVLWVIVLVYFLADDVLLRDV